MHDARFEALFTLVLATASPAQIYGNGSDGALVPTSNLTLDTAANGGVFQFTNINIAAGLVVRIVGPNPAVLLCRGAVDIHGVLDLDGIELGWGPPPAGGYAGGAPCGIYSLFETCQAQNGFGPGGGHGAVGFVRSGGGGSHATAGGGSTAPPGAIYGSAFPFDLQGGSGGGGQQVLINTPSCSGPGSGSGGGALALLAEGSITITGTVQARGWGIGPANGCQVGGAGAGGAILIRSLLCVSISGRVLAAGGFSYNLNGQSLGGDGFVRIDSYSACGAPNLSGATLTPAPLVVSLPFLTALGSAHIGQVYRVRCASAPGDVLGWYFSQASASLPVPPFGTLELDPAAGIVFLGQFTVATTGHDPLAVADLPIPNEIGLVGMTFHSQMFNAFGAVTGQARLSNRLVTSIGN